MTDLNIVDLIEKNPITRLSATYNNKLLLNIQKTFTGFEQKLFVSSFYCYLNYDKNLDFVVDLDNVWIWLGFSSKSNAKVVLEKHFNVDVDYKTSLTIISTVETEQDPATKAKQNGGQNRQIIMLTIKCFKSLCLKAQTKKASEIHEYYMKMEEVLHKIVEEETDELRKQLEQKDNVITKIKETTTKEKARAVEQATIAQFPLNTECIYFGTIDNTNEEKETMIKFGHTNDLATRVQNHHKIYENFVLTAAFRVQNKVEIENLIKAHPKIKRHMRHIEVKGTTKTEIIAYDANLTIERLTKHIKDIIHSKTYSIDNFNRLLKQNDELEAEKTALQEQLEIYKTDLAKSALELHELRELAEKQKASIAVAASETQSVYQNASLPEDEQTKKFSEFIDAACIVRPDVEEASVNMEGQFRIWCGTKPKKETFHALKNYLDTRFKPSRLTIQTKNQVVHGYVGVKLKELVYKKKHTNHAPETFLFQVCAFSPCGKILNSTLLTEYQRWKKTVDLPPSDTDMKDLKDYLNNCEYVVKATVWTDVGSNEGYYGLSLRSDEPKHKVTSSTGKKVEKRTLKENFLITTWETIAKAADAEKFSPAKMSRSIKNKVTFNDEYYYCISEK
jgi:hypothetical protein